MQVHEVIEFPKDEAIQKIADGLFHEVLLFALKDHERSWKAAWLMNQVLVKYELDLSNYTLMVCQSIPSKPSNQQRELLKLLEKVQITDENEGPIFDVATACWEELKLQSGTRMVAFRLMLKIATKHKDLLQEVENLMEERYLKGLSQGVKRAVENRMRGAQAKRH
jgi:hypothetical protein